MAKKDRYASSFDKNKYPYWRGKRRGPGFWRGYEKGHALARQHKKEMVHHVVRKLSEKNHDYF